MRNRGVVGYLMTDPEITGPENEGSYALFVREDGLMLMVHTEGVAYRVTDQKHWTWNDRGWGDPRSYAPDELLLQALREQAPLVDLAEHIRTFGARLESNFHQIHSLLTEVKA